jgi:hypothetical protein
LVAFFGIQETSPVHRRPALSWQRGTASGALQSAN